MWTTAIRPAKAVVVLNASEQGHYGGSGEGPHHTARPPWAELTFVADHDISARLVPLLESREVDAVVFASNAFLAPVSREAVTHPSFVALWDERGPARDVGVVVLHQFLRKGETLPLTFLGSGSFSLVGERPRPVIEQDIQFADNWCFVDDGEVQPRDKRFLALARPWGPEGNSVWARCDFKYPTQWEPLAWDLTNEQPLVALCSIGDRVVVACRLLIDVTGATDLLGSLVAASLRPRGSLLVEAPTTTGSTAFSTALASAIDRQRFVHRVRPASSEEVDPAASPYRFFDELIVAPEWRIDEIGSLSEETVLRKLEQGGSIVATFIGPQQHPVAVRLSGQPQYAARANRLADWLVARLDQFKGDIWAMRGLAEVVDAVEAAYVDPRLIPHALRRDYIRRHLASSLVDRIANDNVDDNVIATLGTFSALTKLGETGRGDMWDWADRRLDKEVPSVLAQALTLEPSLRTRERLDRVSAAVADGTPGPGDDERLLYAYGAALAADDDPTLLGRVAADRSLALSVQGELLRTVVQHGIPSSQQIFDLASNVREQIDQLAAEQGGLEAVCIGNAALIELARQQGIGPTAAIRGRPRGTDARTVEATELIKERETAQRDAEAARRAGRLAVTALVSIIIIAMVIAIGWIIARFDGGPDAKFGFATGVFALLSGFLTYVLKKARDAGIPPWAL